MKKIFLSLAFLLLITNAHASTYYVKPGGGSTTQCTGLADVNYDGSGSGEACAFSHPVYAIGAQNGSGAGAGVMVGGDTLIIDDDDGSGGQAKYQIGYGQPVTGSLCSTADTAGCGLKNLPSGPDSSHPTRILGKNYSNGCATRPQLWGNEFVYHVLSAGADNLEIQCIEITDHSSCIYPGPADGTVDGFPTNCTGRSGSYPRGPTARTGMSLGGTNILLKNLYIHGVAIYAIDVVTDFGNITIEDSDFHANGSSGFNTETTVNGSGTVHFKNTNVTWSGCGERYPLQSTTKDSVLNIHHCYEQQQGAISPDGIAFGHSTNGSAGDWVFEGGKIAWNMADGIDLLHGNGTGTVKASRVHLEGNAGQQIKPTGTTIRLENNLIIDNCGFAYNQSFSSTKDINGVLTSQDLCRAADGNVIITGAGKKAYIYNNTFMTNHYTGAIVVYGDNCDADTVLDVRNNLVYGGRRFRDDTGLFPGTGNGVPSFIYFGGVDGNGGGNCTNGGGNSLNFVNTNNLAYLTQNSNSPCGTGTNNICGSDPLFTGTIKQGPYPTPGYYTDTNYADQLYLQAGSPAVNAGTNSITFEYGAEDFNGITRTGTYDIGALELDSFASCGNGNIDAGEDCDGVNLNSKTCITEGYESGTLACYGSCTFDYSNCVTAGGGGGTSGEIGVLISGYSELSGNLKIGQ